MTNAGGLSAASVVSAAMPSADITDVVDAEDVVEPVLDAWGLSLLVICIQPFPMRAQQVL